MPDKLSLITTTLYVPSNFPRKNVNKIKKISCIYMKTKEKNKLWPKVEYSTFDGLKSKSRQILKKERENVFDLYCRLTFKIPIEIENQTHNKYLFSLFEYAPYNAKALTFLSHMMILRVRES